MRRVSLSLCDFMGIEERNGARKDMGKKRRGRGRMRRKAMQARLLGAQTSVSPTNLDFVTDMLRENARSRKQGNQTMCAAGVEKRKHALSANERKRFGVGRVKAPIRSVKVPSTLGRLEGDRDQSHEGVGFWERGMMEDSRKCYVLYDGHVALLLHLRADAPGGRDELTNNQIRLTTSASAGPVC